ncbi:hypothetical protein ABID92_000415 [Frigoribacterium sp. PvP120]|nr:hypothetical protein [Frigoribacterium sp. PvP121]
MSSSAELSVSQNELGSATLARHALPALRGAGPSLLSSVGAIAGSRIRASPPGLFAESINCCTQSAFMRGERPPTKLKCMLAAGWIQTLCHPPDAPAASSHVRAKLSCRRSLAMTTTLTCARVRSSIGISTVLWSYCSVPMCGRFSGHVAAGACPVPGAAWSCPANGGPLEGGVRERRGSCHSASRRGSIAHNRPICGSRPKPFSRAKDLMPISPPNKTFRLPYTRAELVLPVKEDPSIMRLPRDSRALREARTVTPQSKAAGRVVDPWGLQRPDAYSVALGFVPAVRDH